MSMNDKNLIELLRTYMEENHLSWTQVSRQLGVTQNTLTNWNKGGKNQSPEQTGDRFPDLRSGADLFGDGMPCKRYQRPDHRCDAACLGNSVGTRQSPRLHACS